VLFDGWQLIYQPNSPAALHLLAVLAAHPPEAEAHVALPGEPPAWWSSGASLQVLPTPDTPPRRLEWEQVRIPALARRLRSSLVHLTTSTPALFAAQPGLVSPAGYHEDERSPGLSSRLREALAQGGMSRLRGLLWPDDLPIPDLGIPVQRIPPLAFTGEAAAIDELPMDLGALDIPEAFILYHGPQSERALRRLLAAWSWAAGPLAESYPLLLLGLNHSSQERLASLAGEAGLSRSLHALPAISPFSIPWLYQHCSALFHPASLSPWGGPLRPALAYGRPIVACESPEADALLGQAAYLAPQDSPPRLAAALITVIVEEGVAEQLSQAALQRSAGWRVEAFRQGLLGAYQCALTGRS
jgi:glycosyltransferase involved in cell wall biosynthesis